MTTLTYVIPESFNVVRDKFAAEVINSSSSRPWSHEPFYGKVWNDGFHVFANIPYSIGDLPIAHGSFYACPEGTRVVINLKSEPFVAGLHLFWCLIWVAIIMGSIFDHRQMLVVGIGVVMIVCSCAFYGVGWWLGVNHYKRGFQKVFQMKEQ